MENQTAGTQVVSPSPASASSSVQPRKQLWPFGTMIFVGLAAGFMTDMFAYTPLGFLAAYWMGRSNYEQLGKPPEMGRKLKVALTIGLTVAAIVYFIAISWPSFPSLQQAIVYAMYFPYNPANIILTILVASAGKVPSYVFKPQDSSQATGATSEGQAGSVQVVQKPTFSWKVMIMWILALFGLGLIFALGGVGN